MSQRDAKHILAVFWKIGHLGDPEKMRELSHALEAQSDIPGVLSVRHGPRNVAVDWDGPDKAFDYGMILTFDNFVSARAYVPHPIHEALVATILRLGSEASDIRGFWIDR
jgi:hypothetical protein